MKKRRQAVTYVHQVLLHVMGKVLEHSHLANKVLGNLTCWEDGALTQLCIVMDGPEAGRNPNMKDLQIAGVVCRTQQDQTGHLHGME